MLIDRRQFEREDTEIEAKYNFKGMEYKCMIEDISEDGVGMNIEGTIQQGKVITLILPETSINCKVVYVDGHNVGLKYEKVTTEQLEYIKKLHEGR